MDPSRYERAKELFLEAAELPAEERLRFLDEHCRDAAERRRVESMLEHDAALAAPDDPSRAHDPLVCADDDLGPYTIRSHLGEGGFCVVYLAEQTAPIRREVALKLIKPGLDTRSVIARFDAERQALALMSHPSIARIHDAGVTARGRPYFVMEYVPGLPITDYCDRHRLSIAKRLELFVQVCDAVQHAHQKSILHRDIKPTNVLVTESNGTPKVIDFGIAKSLERKLTVETLHTMAGEFVGTPEYMSPEQAGGVPEDVDTRTDVYSLGVLLYELLAGCLPLESSLVRDLSVRDIPRIIRDYEPRRPSVRFGGLSAATAREVAACRGREPSTLTRELRGDLDWIILKAIEKEPAGRYPTPSELARDVERHLHRDPVAARPPSFGYRAQKLWQRNRGLLTSLAVIVATLAVAVVVSLSLYFEADRTKEELEVSLRRSEGLRLTANSTAALASDPDLALLLALEGARRFDGRESRSAALAALGGLVPHRTLVGHSAWVRSGEFSPDGDRFVTAALDGTARVWNTESGELETVIDVHRGGLEAARFNPRGDAIAVASRDGTVSVSTLAGELRHHFEGPDSAVFWLAWIDDERLVAAWTSRAVRAWTVDEGKETASISTAGERLVVAGLSPDGRRIAVGTEGGRAAVWGLEDANDRVRLGAHLTRVIAVEFGRQGERVYTADYVRAYAFDAKSGARVRTFGEVKSNIHGLRCSPDGRWLVIVSDDRIPSLWDTETGERGTMFDGHAASVVSAAFSADGRRLVTGSIDDTARVWDAESGVLLSTLLAHRHKVTGVVFSLDGNRVGTASGDSTAAVWDIDRATLGRLVHRHAINEMELSVEGDRILTGTRGKEAMVWDLGTRRRLATLRGHRGSVVSVGFSADGRSVLTQSIDRTARLWDVESGESKQMWRHDSSLIYASLSPDGNNVCTAEKALTTVRVFAAHSGELRHELETGASLIWRVGFSPDSRLVFATTNRGVFFWDIDSGARSVVLRGHDVRVHVADFHAASGRVLTTSHDATARVWDLSTGEEISRLTHGRQLGVGEFSRDGTRVITAANEPVAYIWNAATGEVLVTFSGHEARLNSAVFSPDERTVLTTSFDGTARLWDAESGEELLVYSGHDGRLLRGASFTPDGRWAVTGSIDNSVHIWPVDPLLLAAKAKPRELSARERARFGLGVESAAKEIRAKNAEDRSTTK